MLSSFPRTVQKRRVHGIPHIFNIPLCLPIRNLKLGRQSSGIRICILHNSVVKPNHSLISRNKNTSPVEFVHAFIQNALHELQRATQWLSVNMCHPASSVLSYYDLRFMLPGVFGPDDDLPGSDTTVFLRSGLELSFRPPRTQLCGGKLPTWMQNSVASCSVYF